LRLYAFARRKKKKKYGAQRRQAAKASGKQTGKNPPWQTRGGLQFLCGSACAFARVNKKYFARKVAKPQRREACPPRRKVKPNGIM
jgi:hypothetical protein